jgi:prevent-host-death family protein
MIVNVHEAKTHLSRLLDRAAAGEEIVIGRAGKPVARLVALPERPPREFGRLAGRIAIDDDFDEPDGELADLFEGSTG